MPKIVKFPAKEPNKPLIDVLENLISEAKAGDIHGAIVIRFTDEGKFGISKIGVVSDLEILGSLDFVKYDIMANNRPD